MKFLKFGKEAVLEQFCILDLLLILMLGDRIYVKPVS